MVKINFKFIRDIFRDKDSLKYSATKFTAHISSILLWVFFLEAGLIMWVNKEIDHYLIGELMVYILTLLGFKNIRKKGPEINNNSNGPEIL